MRNEVVEELPPDLVGESRAELKVELMRDGRNKGMEGEKGRRGEKSRNSQEKRP